MRLTNCSGRLTNSGARKPAAPSTTAVLKIDDLLANGQGVGRRNGMVAFISGALPGEEAQAAIDVRKANYLSGHATAILKVAPERVASPCAVFPTCGGCQVLHLSYPAQLQWKQRMLRDALVRIGDLKQVNVEQVQPSELIEGTRYRNKVSLVAGVCNGKPVVGFYAARSHRVVPISECPVLLPRLDRAVKQFVELSHEQLQLLRDVRHIVLRASANGKSLVLSLNTSRRTDQRESASTSASLRQRIEGLTGIVTTWNPASENAIFGRSSQTLWGEDRIHEAVYGSEFVFGVASFFQINTPVLEEIAHALVTRLRSARRIVDLYCGVGTFAVLLGKCGVAGTGVESYPASVDQAAANAARNSVHNVAFECATAEQAVAGPGGRSLLEKAEAVILDPPRRGCEPDVLHALKRERVARVEYLSCNPATLARDAKILTTAGYRMSSVKPYDMFPHTGHVEALAEFELQ